VDAPADTGTRGVRAVVAGHGTFAAGVISAVEQITGRGSIFAPVSNTGLGLDDMAGRIGQALDESGARVVFTDLPAGSCTMVVRRQLRERPGTVLVTGANVPLLLDFAMHDDDADPVEAVRQSLERARAVMTLHGG
jgi:PTS system N-acetylgalactosamine-specific IIA component